MLDEKCANPAFPWRAHLNLGAFVAGLLPYPFDFPAPAHAETIEVRVPSFLGDKAFRAVGLPRMSAVQKDVLAEQLSRIWGQAVSMTDADGVTVDGPL